MGIEAEAVWVQDKEEALSEVQRDRFEDLLRGLTAHRAVVRDAMTFCLDNSACATEVVDILTESLTLAETPIPTKVRCTPAPRPVRTFPPPVAGTACTAAVGRGEPMRISLHGTPVTAR